jgi:hypothetical protein
VPGSGGAGSCGRGLALVTLVDVDSALSSLAGVLVGGIATYASQRGLDTRREKRESVRGIAARYDAAIAAVATVEASRWGPGVHYDAATFPAISGEAEKELLQQLDTEALRRFLDAKLSARAALAALHPSSPDLKRYWYKNEPAAESEFDELISLLATRRRELFERAVRAH